MILCYNKYGTLSLSDDYFSQLVSIAAQNCYGVAGLAPADVRDKAMSVLMMDGLPNKGVRVSQQNGELIIDLHIKVTYGLNISAIVKSIAHKVKYTVENATGLTVHSIRVSVDDIV